MLCYTIISFYLQHFTNEELQELAKEARELKKWKAGKVSIRCNHYIIIIMMMMMSSDHQGTTGRD